MADGTVTITRGYNQPPAIWRFWSDKVGGTVYPLGGKVISLVIGRTSELIFNLNSVDSPALLAVDSVAGTVTWNYTVSDTFLLPVGSGIIFYRLEWRIGVDQGPLIKRAPIVVEEGPDAV